MTWVERETVVYDLNELPFDDNGKLEIANFSSIRIKTIGFIYPVDIGSWCYTTRKKMKPKTNDDTCSIVVVKIDSYRQERVDFLSRYIDYLSVYIVGKSNRTISGSITTFRTFIEWCDTNSPESLDRKEKISSAFRQFSDELVNKIRTNELNVNTAAKNQVVPITAIQWMYNDKYGEIFEGIRRIRRSNAATNHTIPPDKGFARTNLKIYQSIFHQFSNFVMHFQNYPLKLSLPHSDFWIFPIITINPLNERSNRYSAFNYEEGRLNTLEEIEYKTVNSSGYVSDKKRRALAKLHYAEKTISQANTNKYHPRRIRLATLAQQSFLMLFSADTGMGIEQISNLVWPKGSHKISNKLQGFKTIKKRANGRKTEFLITSTFIPLFNKYLILRKYLLSSNPKENTEFLFFGINKEGTIVKLSPTFSNNFSLRLKKNFNIKNLVTTRQWRAYKSDWLIKNTDIATTATVLQNSKATVLRHYIAGSESESKSELTTYFDAFNTALVNRKIKLKPTSAGQCTSPESPTPLNSQVPNQPDCIKPEGCLFCKNYAIHADAIDYKKLLSFKYVIQQTQYLTASNEHYCELFNPVLSRIDNAVKTIESSKKISCSLLEKIQKDIYENEHLDPYWGKKLQLLIDLDIIK